MVQTAKNRLAVQEIWSSSLGQKDPLGMGVAMHACILSGFSCVWLWEPLDYTLPGSSVHGDSPGKNTGMVCHALLQGNLPNLEIELLSLVSLTWAGLFFTSATWKACIYVYGGSDRKESACNTGDANLIPGSGRSLGEGNGYSLQYTWWRKGTLSYWSIQKEATMIPILQTPSISDFNKCTKFLVYGFWSISLLAIL